MIFARFAVFALSLMALSCASSAPTGIARVADREAKYSILHVSGKITRIPKDSKWPASVKIGAPFEYWAVIDNQAKDVKPSPQHGVYLQTGAPARYELSIGSGFHFSSERISPRRFTVSINDGLPANPDGYFISPNYHTRIPEAPELHAVSFSISLATDYLNLIRTDKLPLRPLETRHLNGGLGHQFYGRALLKETSQNHGIAGRAEKMEVFQAVEDAPIP